jgi:hypothetical protein
MNETAKLRHQLAAAQRDARVFPGVGVRLLRMGKRGTIFRASSSGTAHFYGAWFVDLSADTITVQPGRVNFVMAKIEDIPLDDPTPPTLRLRSPKVDDEGRGYICAECFFYGPDEKDGKGKPLTAWSVREVQIVQVANPDTDDGLGKFTNSSGAAVPLKGNRCRCPIAMIRDRGGNLEVFQVEYFDLRHRASLKKDGISAKRHFFF